MQSLATAGQNTSEILRTGLVSRGDDWVDKSYLAKVRRFKTGAVEVAVTRVDARQMKNMLETNFYGLPMGYKKDQVELSESERKQRDLDNHQRSVRRARQHIRYAVKAIGADHLLTLTYRTPEGCPMDDVERLKADWKRFCRLVKSGLPASDKYRSHAGLDSWKFVAVREKQENGSYHLHVAVVGRQDISYIRRCWYVAIGGNQDDSGVDTKGQIDVRGPSKRWGSKTANWKPDKLAGYMTKYLHKTFDEVEAKGAKRYWAGRTNDEPEVLKIWLGAQNFEDAIKESHALFRTHSDRKGLVIWASDGYESIWLSA